jgi:hypothetical protein
MYSKSILRNEEYDALSTVEMQGKVLDVGGSKSASYQKLISGNPEFFFCKYF